MPTEVLKRPYNFDRFAWGMAAACALLIIGAAVLILHWAVAFYQSYALQNFNELLLKNRIPEARLYVGRLFERAPLIGFAQSSSQLPPRELRPFVDGVLETIALFEQLDFAGLEEQVKKLSAYRPLLREVPELQSQWSMVELFVNNAKIASNKMAALDAESKTLALEVRRTTDQYDLLTRDVSEFFSLRSATDVATGSLPPFYRAGVLNGLPALRGIPDNIGSLEELRAVLERSGGKVVLGGENIAAVFQERLAAFRNTGNGLLEKFVEINKNYLEVSRQLQTAKSDLNRLRSTSEDALKNIVTTVLATDSSVVR